MEWTNNVTIVHVIELFFSVYMIVAGTLMMTGKNTLSRKTQEIYTEESIKKALPSIGGSYALFGLLGLGFTVMSVMNVSGSAIKAMTGAMFAGLALVFLVYYRKLERKGQ